MITLITAASNARAYKLKNALASQNVLLGDYEDLPEVMVTSGKMIKLPNPSGAAYIHEMLALCLDKSITVVIILREQEFNLLSQALQLFEEYDIKIEQPDDSL